MRLAIAIALFATAARAATVWIDAEHNIIPRPQNYGAIANVSDATLALFGIVQATGPDGVEQRFWTWGETNFISIPQADIDAILAAEAEAAAEAAQFVDPQPAVFVPRVSGSLTNVVGQSQILVAYDTGIPFAVDETGSPEHTLAMKAAQNAEREAKKAAAREAKASGQLQRRIAALEALAGIE